MDLQHPLVQSIAAPLLLALAGGAALRAVLGPVQGPRWAALALGLGVVGAASLLMPWRWPPGALVEKLPWCLAVAWVLGAALEALRAARATQWAVSALSWLALSWWLGAPGAWVAVACMLAGAGVLAALHSGRDGHATAAAVAVAASLGLAAIAFTAGSLLLMQMALLLAAAAGGTALLLWPRAHIRFGAGAPWVAGITWLAVAQSAALLTPAPRGALLLLALGFAAVPVATQLRLPPARAAWLEPLIAAVLAATAAVGAVAWTMQAPAAGGAADDPYYQPNWD